ncbi:MAG: hypothetical protein NWF01_07830 [Candidatus Bathyarchaeota archaeon]|nr:hypothetical protein [Candidatus Bathyarchaeota archaeon]
MTNDQDIQYGDSAAAARAIHSALSGLEAVPSGHRVTKWAFTWNVDGSLATAVAYEDLAVLFTLTYTWVSGNLQTVVRS